MSGETPRSVRGAVQAISREGLPEWPFMFPRTYTIVGYTEGSGTPTPILLDLIPPPSSPELPPLAKVPQWLLGGAQITPFVPAAASVSHALGATSVIVVFLDANPTAPVVIAFGPGAVSRVDMGNGDVADIAATAHGRVVRYGDPILFSVPGAGTVELPVAGLVSRVKG